MTVSASELNQLKHAPPVDGVLPVILERWSARAFDGRDVSAADLKKVFEAARWAPSSSNEQPWLYIVGLRGTETHRKLAAALAGVNKAWAPKAPVLMVSLARKNFAKNNSPNGYAFHDLGAASALLVLQATALGLATHQMAGYDRDAVKQAFQIPEDYLFGSMIALGYQGDPELLGDKTLIERELAARSRKPLSEMVFSAWGEPAKLG